MCGTYARLSEPELDRVLNDPESVLDVLLPEEDDGRTLDIDKAWHAIHFLLNGAPWAGERPLYDAVLGGTEFGEDGGYGPPRYLRPIEVSNVASALRAISGDVLWSRFSETEFARAEIYPDGWRATEEERSYVLEHYDRLRDFFDAAAQAGQVIILCLT